MITRSNLKDKITAHLKVFGWAGLYAGLAYSLVQALHFLTNYLK